MVNQRPCALKGGQTLIPQAKIMFVGFPRREDSGAFKHNLEKLRREQSHVISSKQVSPKPQRWLCGILHQWNATKEKQDGRKPHKGTVRMGVIQAVRWHHGHMVN